MPLVPREGTGQASAVIATAGAGPASAGGGTGASRRSRRSPSAWRPGSASASPATSARISLARRRRLPPADQERIRPWHRDRRTCRPSGRTSALGGQLTGGPTDSPALLLLQSGGAYASERWTVPSTATWWAQDLGGNVTSVTDSGDHAAITDADGVGYTVGVNQAFIVSSNPGTVLLISPGQRCHVHVPGAGDRRAAAPREVIDAPDTAWPCLGRHVRRAGEPAQPGAAARSGRAGRRHPALRRARARMPGTASRRSRRSS